MVSSRAGQSFVELLIAIALGAIFMVGTSVIIISSVGESSQATKVQTGAMDAQGLLNNVRVWSEGSWNNILALATGSSYQYYLITSSSPYTATSGIQSFILGTTTYTDYFYISDGYRSGSGIPTTTPSGNSYDPSTKLISVIYGWSGGTTTTVNMYITRNGDVGLEQTDWSGGPSSTIVATSAGNQFASSTNIDYTTSTGSLYLSIPGY